MPLESWGFPFTGYWTVKAAVVEYQLILTVHAHKPCYWIPILRHHGSSISITTMGPFYTFMIFSKKRALAAAALFSLESLQTQMKNGCKTLLWKSSAINHHRAEPNSITSKRKSEEPLFLPLRGLGLNTKTNSSLEQEPTFPLEGGGGNSSSCGQRPQ